MGRSEKQPCVYVLASKRNGTLYIGVTSNLVQRIWQHKNNEVEGFTKKYQVHLLVYYEPIPKQFLTTSDKRLRKGNRSSNTIAVPI